MSTPKKDFATMDIDDQVDWVNEVLEPEIYPALMMDGGGMEIMDIEGTNIKVRYYGACGNCAIGESATFPYIEQTLKMAIDPRITVEQV
ncbi:NifU family protein [Candidatus Peregrinibacteria bacterium]|nr:MAG: NifU family protein [Candidatus Peregrinibacteria bacterium]